MRALIGGDRIHAAGLPLSDAEICDELVLFMLAGHDTTSTTITYALWALGRHRELQDRVLDEVAELGDRALTPDDIPRLRFTVQVLHEALRLCPPAPSISRMAMRDVEVDGYRVPAGTMAVVGIYAMQRDPALWDDPLEFDPDRFSPERSRAETAGSTCRSAAGRGRASATTSPCWRPPWRSRPSCGRSTFGRWTTNSPIVVPFTAVAAGPIRATVLARI